MSSVRNSIIFWKSHKTGFTGHGSLIENKSAIVGAAIGNSSYPMLDHRVVTLPSEVANELRDKDPAVLDVFSPFKKEKAAAQFENKNEPQTQKSRCRP